MSDLILVARDGPIATVTLNRPDKLNAMTKPMWTRLGAVMGELSGADDLTRPKQCAHDHPVRPNAALR